MPSRPRAHEEDASFSPLPAGRHGLDRQVVAEHQRARVVQAMVKLVVEQGFQRVTITALCKRARVTERAFYAQFDGLEQCFLAAYDSILDSYGGDILSASEAQLPWRELLKGALGALLQTTAEHPEHAHLVLVDALAAGSAGIERNRRLTDDFQSLFAAHAAGAPGPNRVSGLVLRGLVGGVRDVVYNRVASGRAVELPGLLDSLFDWVLSYLSDTPLELARAGRTRRRSPAAPAPAPPPLAGHGYPREYVRANQRQRLMDAVAAISREKGYGALTVSGIARRARVSHQTFYDHFRDRDQAFVSTYRQDCQEVFTACAEAYLAHRHDWPRAAQAGLGRLLEWLAPRPDHAHLGFVGLPASGAEAYPIRCEAMQSFAALLTPGYGQSSDVPAIASEAIAGAVFEVIAEEILRGRVERLPEVLPLVTYLALAPFIGAEEAVMIGHERALVVEAQPAAGKLAGQAAP